MSEIKNSNGVITLTSGFINIESTGSTGINLGATSINLVSTQSINLNHNAGSTSDIFMIQEKGSGTLVLQGDAGGTGPTDQAIYINAPNGNIHIESNPDGFINIESNNINFIGTIDFDQTSFANISSDDIPEGSINLYFSGKYTDDLPEGVTNLYFTNERGISAIEHSTIIQFVSPNTVELNHTDGSTGNFIIYQKGLTGNLVLQADSTNVDAVSINAPAGGLLTTVTQGIQLNAGTTSGMVVDNGGILLTAGGVGDIVLQAGQGGLEPNGGRIVMESIMQLPTFVNVSERDSTQQAVGTTGDIAFVAGTQQLCIQDGTQWSNIQTMNSSVNYRYYRWNINRVADFGVDSGIQSSEFKFLNNGVDVDMSGITSTFYFTQDSYTDEDHPILNLIDGLTGTFWYANLATAGLTEPFNSAVYFEFDFGTPTTTNGYKLTTGPDASSRDPVEWTIEGTNNAAGEWFVIDSISQSQRVLENVGRIQDITLQYNLDNTTQLTSYSQDLTISSKGGKIVMDSLMTLPTYGNVGGRDSSFNQVLGATGDIAYLSNSNTLCINNGLQWKNVEIPNTTVKFQRYRWNIKRIANWGTSNYVEVSRFRFLNNGTEVDMSGVIFETNISSVTNHRTNTTYNVTNLVGPGIYWKGILAEKTQPFEGYGNTAIVIFNFTEPVETNGYKWSRGNSPDADTDDITLGDLGLDYSPIEWTLEGSNDPTGNVWFEIANVSQSENILQNVGANQYVTLNYNSNNKSQLNSYTNNLSINAIYNPLTYPSGANIDINSGDANADGLGGHIYLSSGIGRGNDASGGDIQLQTGYGQRSGNGGSITLTSNNGGSGEYDLDTSTSKPAGDGGHMSFTSGAGGSGVSGVTGSYAGNGGDITFTTGDGGNKNDSDYAGNGGSFTFTAGNGGNQGITGKGDGGDFTITAGNCNGTDGALPGDVNITSGTNNTTMTKGNIKLEGGLIINNAGPVYSMQPLYANGDISLSKLITTFDASITAINATLGFATEGQMKILTLINATHPVSVSSPGITSLGFTSITLDTLGSCATLLYTSNGWVIVNERNVRVE